MHIPEFDHVKSSAVRQQKTAMTLSLAVGFLMLTGKMYAFIITGSAAILSDAAESVVHVLAVAFAAFSLWLSLQPADDSHPYGHDKISFFSAGFEGAMIVIAALFIIYEAIMKWIGGLELQNLGTGTLYVAGAGLINAGLGAYLVWQGKRHKALILIANGKHVLTDSWTSFGVVVGLLLTLWTGWLPFDPLLAILVALNILRSGGNLIRQSIGGLMDELDPETHTVVLEVLEKEAKRRGLEYHEVRHRNTGASLWIDLHLLFPNETNIEEAHWKATEVEAKLKAAFAVPVTISTHLEPINEHDRPHVELKDSKE
jgi:cation diffusion facilitator family transporter